MRIDGITTAVGDSYIDILEQALPVWWETLNSLTIATKPNTHDIRRLNDLIHNNYGPKFRAFETGAFGQYFNLGAARNAAFDRSNPTDWVLSFDCDIIPPMDWRKIAEKEVVRECLNGARRFDRKGKCLDGYKYIPKGYFQLWNVNDPYYYRPVPFIEWCEHAGRNDTIFRKQWPEYNELGFRLTHIGEKTKNWFGEGTTPRQMKKALQDARTNRNG